VEDSMNSKASSQAENSPQFVRPFNGYSDVVVLRSENFPETHCYANSDTWNADSTLKNCIYTVGTNWSPMWTIPLHDGEYGYTPKDINNPRDESTGPAYVGFEDYVLGDLNKDGLDDAVVILHLNYGGTGNFLNLIVLTQRRDGEYEQRANYKFLDREIIRGLSVYEGVITANVIVKAETDPACCPTVYDTYRFKLKN
jgi:hypothetical protein